MKSIRDHGRPPFGAAGLVLGLGLAGAVLPAFAGSTPQRPHADRATNVIYWYRLATDGRTVSRKLILTR